MGLIKKYIDLEVGPTGENALEISVDYTLGGHSYLSGKNVSRGYYLYCTPCEVSEKQLFNGKPYRTVTTTAFRGLKVLLKEVSRQSKKAEQEALNLAAEKEDWLVSEVCKSYGLKIKV